jgi:hypothetical protein
MVAGKDSLGFLRTGLGGQVVIYKKKLNLLRLNP